MKNLIFLFILSCALLLTMQLNSCKKKPIVTNPTPTDPLMPPTTNPTSNGAAFRKAFFTGNGVATQTFTVNTNSMGSITGAQGTIINIFPNAFVTAQGAPVTGVVTINLREIYSKGEMIRSGVLTVSNGKLLVSGGELFINATQNNQTLKLANNQSILVSMQKKINNPNDMQEFYTRAAIDTTNWGDPQDTIVVIPDSSSVNGSYYFALDSLGWINCDYFYANTNPLTTVNVTIADTSFNSSNTMVFISFNGLNSAMGCYQTNVVSTFAANYVPTNMPVTIVAISQKGTNYYAAFASTSITNNHVQSLTPTITSLSAIQTALGLLP
jgi:hypothetical protein